ncbi:MAG TPA: hypothetical protein VEM36_04590 [Xanthobacteraceae bacterium]|nr:hypothetical protein [Xanthobacteraceae bacterium]
MPHYSIPRRPFSPQNEEQVPVNWRRGMFRVWLLVSAAWMMGWIIQFIMYGLQGGFKYPADVLAIPVLLIGPPVALLLFGIAAGWAFRGFKVEDRAAND